MLPERKSKIATLLKQDGQAYCICRSSDSSRFMIGCDACEEWYHGDCINITEREAKHIKQYFCDRCREDDSSLITRFKPKKIDQPDQERTKYKKYKDKDYDYDNNTSSYQSNDQIIKKTSKRCGECSGCRRLENCGKCDPCRHLKKFVPSARIKLRCIQRTCRTVGIPLKSLKNLNRPTKPNKKRKRDSSNERNDLLDQPPRHCHGPACLKQSIVGSKYCSDECGIKLATARIFSVLPHRLQEWALTPCISEQSNIKALENIRKQQNDVKKILQELDKRNFDLDRIVERARHATIDPHSDIDENDDTEMSMYCITCGHEVHSRAAIRHMEKCFNKVI